MGSGCPSGIRRTGSMLAPNGVFQGREAQCGAASHNVKCRWVDPFSDAHCYLAALAGARPCSPRRRHRVVWIVLFVASLSIVTFRESLRSQSRKRMVATTNKRCGMRLTSSGRMTIRASCRRGDSWFCYPVWRNLIDYISASNKFAICRRGESGQLLKGLVDDGLYLDAVKSEKPVALLIGGGGNNLPTRISLLAQTETAPYSMSSLRA